MIVNPNVIGPIQRSIDLQDFKYLNLPDPGDPVIFETDTGGRQAVQGLANHLAQSP
jgi:hypothetical protein